MNLLCDSLRVDLLIKYLVIFFFIILFAVLVTVDIHIHFDDTLVNMSYLFDRVPARFNFVAKTVNTQYLP